MAIQQAVGVGVGIGAGELATRIHEADLLDEGTLATLYGGVAAGVFGPLLVNKLAGQPVFAEGASRLLFLSGLSASWWAAGRFQGIAPRLAFQPPDEINLVAPLTTAVLTSVAVAGIGVLLPSARSLF